MPQSENLISLPPPAPLRVLSTVTQRIMEAGYSVPLVVLQDFRSENDFRSIVPDYPGSIHQYRHTLGRDLTVLQLHGIATATAVVADRDFRDWADEQGVLTPDAPYRFAEYLVNNESPDVIYVSSYPDPKTVTGLAPDGAIWAAHIRPPFFLSTVSFGSIVGSGTGKKSATMFTPDGSDVPATIRDALLAVAQQNMPGDYDLRVSELPSPKPPRFLTVSAPDDDVGYRAILHTESPRFISRVRSDVPALCGVSWIDQPQEAERVPLLEAAHEFLQTQVTLKQTEAS